ncbi:MAG: ferrous iron transport protein B [Deltaproteobacteria bacterium]|nr:ferrous iron transport protein B [Deltaproteobacteria bacterium]
MKRDSVLMALAGQPNCGKSTVFNALTGASQHVANYPGVTVEKMTGRYNHDGLKVEVVDLPGTYSLTSYSLEERVTRGFLLEEKPSVVVNVVDASNLKRNLYLTLQLLEMEAPLVMDLNMMDVAGRRGIVIDSEALSKQLGIPVVETAIKTGKGKTELLSAISETAGNRAATDGMRKTGMRMDYGSMEPFLREIETRLSVDDMGNSDHSVRWLSVKLMEGDDEALKYIRKKLSKSEPFLEFLRKQWQDFESRTEELPARHIAYCRYRHAEIIAGACLAPQTGNERPMSDKIDGVVCNRFLGPLILVGVLYMLYYLSLVQGYNLTNYTWPLLAKIRNLTADLAPVPGFIEIPLLRAFSLWFVDSINALLNYIPIFFILFGLIAILEDSGYMPRMAFILDRLFARFGLHGSSTLPMVLGGIYVGGCAVPAVMSTKGIPDERSRLATIMIIPLLNCLAKVPLYVLLINIYFVGHKGMAMFFISTISLLMVLPVAKLLTLTVLKKRPTAPFIMEMPPYHLPTFRGVFGRAVERVWLFIRKIITIVAAVAVVVFVLLQFPGISQEREAYFAQEKERAISKFYKKIEKTPYAEPLQGENLMALVLYWDDYKVKKMGIKGKEASLALNERFKERNSDFFKIVKPGKDKIAKKANRAFKKLIKARKKLLREIKKEKIDCSFLGRMGRFLEPATQYAGFNWKVNVALLSAFAAKESSVATLGALYDQGETGAETLEERMNAGETGFTPLHALALMLFMVLYPPCIATAIMVKIQSGSIKWMLFSMIYPMCLGIIVATLVFSGGSALGLSGNEAMVAFYGIALTLTIIMGFVRKSPDVN